MMTNKQYTPKDFAIGQQLWYVPNDRRWRSPRYVTVEKIGRKWVQTNYGRFDPAEMWEGSFAIDTGVGLASRLWLTKEAWEYEQQRSELCKELSSKLDSWRGEYRNASLEKLQQVKAIMEGT
jgi:hypothetical protein